MFVYECYDLKVCIPPKIYILKPNVMVIKDGDFGR